MAEWRVMIVEDDAVVARLHSRFVAQAPGFVPIGVARTAAEATRMVETLRPHLILLDLGLPGEDGIALLRQLRARGDPIEVIVVSAASGRNAVRATVQLGVVDYLVKPFQQERLRKSLGLFHRRLALLGNPKLTQDQVDRVCSEGPNAYRWLPRDLSDGRLRRIQEILAASPGPLTATDVGADAGVSRVTARRYLEYLVTVGQVTTDTVSSGPGRPRKTYSAATPPELADSHA
jgi:response regulator of citrate/malate metabolism